MRGGGGSSSMAGQACRGGGRSWRVPCVQPAPRGENRLGRGKHAAAHRMGRAGGPVAAPVRRAAWPWQALVGWRAPFYYRPLQGFFPYRTVERIPLDRRQRHMAICSTKEIKLNS